MVETTALLAALTGGNLAWLHWLATASTVAAALATMLLAGTLVVRLTGDGWAGATAAALVVSVPGFHHYAAFGFHPKYFLLAFGLGAVYLSLAEQPLAAGVAAAASVAYWQVGAVFAAAVGADAASRGTLRLVVAGMVGAGAIVVAPVVAEGAVTAMLVETVVAPLATSEGVALGARAAKFAALLGPTIPVVAGGLVAAAATGVAKREWWLVAAVGLACAQVAFVDFDWLGDLFPIGTVAAIGVGLAVARVPASRRRRIVIVGLLVVALSWSVVAAPTVMDGIGGRYWSAAAPESCHYHLGGTERRWLDQTVRTVTDDCGALPPGWPPDAVGGLADAI